MQKIKQIEPLVKTILSVKPSTRRDDFELYYHAVREHFINNPQLGAFDECSFEKAMLHHKTMGLPSYESVTRCRRRLQAKHPELKDPKKAAERSRAEKEFRAYAYS